LTLLSKNSCFVKTGGRFFQILWPSYNVLTLPCRWREDSFGFSTDKEMLRKGLILYAILLLIDFTNLAKSDNDYDSNYEYPDYEYPDAGM
jgi:hypothetical protein